MLGKVETGVTIGDGCCTQDDFKTCFTHGVSLFRFNLANAWLRENIVNIHSNLKAAQKTLVNCDAEILLDIPFPKAKVRYRTFNREKYHINEGMEIQVTSKKSEFNNISSILVDISLTESLELNDIIIIGDGELSFTVVSVINNQTSVLKALNNWFISDSKSILVTGKEILTESKIKEELSKIADTFKNEKVSLALSFAENEQDIEAAKALGFSYCEKYYAKIETRTGVENIDRITDAFDAVMVARGDLALYDGIENLGKNQEKIIHTCNKKEKKVYVATEVFSGLVDRAIPTRAELSDYYNLKGMILNGGFIFTKEVTIVGVMSKTLNVIKKFEH